MFASAVIVLAWLTVTLTEERRRKKVDDLPVIVTYQSGTLVMLTSKVNGPVTHGSTQKCLIWLMEAFD